MGWRQAFGLQSCLLATSAISRAEAVVHHRLTAAGAARRAAAPVLRQPRARLVAGTGPGSQSGVDNAVVAHGRSDEDFMAVALEQARRALATNEVPVGAVLVDMSTGELLASAGNLVESSYDATAHAEILCMRQAALTLKNWRLTDCALYVTLEPCPMCTAAMRSFRLGRLVYGASSERLGAISGSMASDKVHPFHAAMRVESGVLADECATVLKEFFQRRRKESQAAQEADACDVTGGPSRTEDS
jgi:tRNA(adenine34) deaminase